MKPAFALLLTAAVLVAAGMVIFYFYGYKDSLWIQGSAYLPVVFGWLSLLFFVVFLHPQKPNREQPGNHTWQRVKHAVYFILYPVLLVGLVGLFAALEIAKDKRVDTVLSKPDSKQATATVTGREERYWRTSHHTYAIISYSTLTGTVQQAIQDDYGLYQAGQRIPITYSPDYPDMFRVGALGDADTLVPVKTASVSFLPGGLEAEIEGEEPGEVYSYLLTAPGHEEMVGTLVATTGVMHRVDLLMKKAVMSVEPEGVKKIA